MLPLTLWFVAVFVVGLLVGSFLNLCAIRLPYERPLFWPGPRCDSCRQRIGLLDCLPVLGYLLLAGRCRTCRQRISWRYPVVELCTALVFVALFAFVCGTIEAPLGGRRWRLPPANDPWATLAVFSHHAVLISFLIVASLCDLEDMEIPLSLTVCGTLLGLVFSVLLAWPYPGVPPASGPVLPRFRFELSVYAWPLWWPLPAWLPPGTWQVGLATGLAGALAGMVLLRGVRFLFGLGRGREGMGVGDADLMMMAGAFIGWQPVVLAFFVAVFPGLFFAIINLVRGKGQALPFGPSLALGVVLTVLAWPALGPYVQPVFFDPLMLLFLGVMMPVMLLFLGFILRLILPGAAGEPGG
jgi:leader peptidase (prepilin peptidase)/N-methyltransferase